MSLADRILFLVPNAVFTIRDDDYNRLDWDAANTAPKPTLLALQSITDNDLAANRAQKTAESIVDNTQAKDRLLLAVLFNMENRIRTLENVATVTRPQYRQRLIDLYKALP